MKQERTFGIIFGFIFLGLGLWPFVWLHQNPRWWFIGMSLVLLVLATFFPKVLYYPCKLWGLIGHLLAKINSTIVLFFLFYLVMAPLGMLLRLLGKRPLHLYFTETQSYWIDREQSFSDMRKQF